MKIKLLLIFSLFLIECSGNDKYYEYELTNKSNSTIKVKILTTGDPYRPILEYVIEPQKTERIFEFKAYGEYGNKKTLIPINEKCKFISSLEITNKIGKKSTRDFNSNDCCSFRVLNGSTAQQGIYTLVIENKDFE
jgi:hypothetical protein